MICKTRGIHEFHKPDRRPAVAALTVSALCVAGLAMSGEGVGAPDQARAVAQTVAAIRSDLSAWTRAGSTDRGPGRLALPGLRQLAAPPAWEASASCRAWVGDLVVTCRQVM